MIPTIEWMVEQAEAAGQAALAALPMMECEVKPDATVVTNIDRMVETYAATAGGGERLNGRPIRAPDLERLRRDDTVGIGSEAVHRVDLTQFISRQRNFGAVAVHLAYTARGALRGNVSGDDKLYDIAAGLLITTEAGCRAEWLCGSEVSLQSWLDGTQPDDLLLVAPPRILAALRAAFLGGRSE